MGSMFAGWGRPKAMTIHKLALARALFNDPHTSEHTICRTHDVSKATLYRCLKSRIPGAP
jgi:helix-turn-helix resolvase-like protein